MKKTSILLSVVLSAFIVNAQTADSAITQGSANDVYYSFKTSGVAEVDKSTWDIALNTAAFDASILINESAGVELYSYSVDTSEWNSVDTAGFHFENEYNSQESWSDGAFVRLATGHPDYGWGTYNSGNHDVNGSRLFIVKGRDGNFYQVVIEKMSAAGVYTLKIGDLGGANTSNITINKKDAAYANKNFVQFDLSSKSVLNQEPDTKDWDLLFTKYIAMIQAGPDLVPYPVSGVKINKNYQVAERNGVDNSSNDTSSLSWNENITEIGSDWKSFNMGTFAYDIVEQRTYFVRGNGGAVWKIYFTGYKGGATGGFYFNIEQLRSSVSVKESYKLASKLYPNPASGSFTIENNENKKIDVTISTLMGGVVNTTEIYPNSLEVIDALGLTSGVYVVTISTGSKVSTERVVIK